MKWRDLLHCWIAASSSPTPSPIPMGEGWGEGDGTFLRSKKNRQRGIIRAADSIFDNRLNLRLLHRGQLPGVGAHRPGECPVLFELHRVRVAAADHRGLFVNRVVEQVRVQPDSDKILAVLGPHLRDLAVAQRDIVHAVFVSAGF